MRQVLLLAMLAPRSYTREDVVEVHTHGGAVCAARAMAACLAAGARRARAGEFTLRAFLSGRLDLAQARRRPPRARIQRGAVRTMCVQPKGLFGIVTPQHRADSDPLCLLAHARALSGHPHRPGRARGNPYPRLRPSAQPQAAPWRFGRQSRSRRWWARARRRPRTARSRGCRAAPARPWPACAPPRSPCLLRSRLGWTLRTSCPRRGCRAPQAPRSALLPSPRPLQKRSARKASLLVRMSVPAAGAAEPRLGRPACGG